MGVNILGKNIRNPGKTKSEGNENEMKVFKENKAALNWKFNNNILCNFMKCLCTFDAMIYISRSNKLFNKAEI